MKRLQLDIDFSRKARDQGIQRAVDSAEERTPSWADRAFVVLREYLDLMNTPFMAEDFRLYVETHQLLPTPPSARAYGGPIVRAVKAGLIKRQGYAPVMNVKAHHTPATLWIRI